jgi:hypothetical protein
LSGISSPVPGAHFPGGTCDKLSRGALSQWAYQGERLGTALLQGDSGMFELAIEVAARPAEKKKNHGEEAGTHGHDKGFSFPTLLDQVIEENEAEDEQTNEADEHAEWHEHGLEDGAFALAGKPFGTRGKSGHRSALFPTKRDQKPPFVKSENDVPKQPTAKYGWSGDSGIPRRCQSSPRQ